MTCKIWATDTADPCEVSFFFYGLIMMIPVAHTEGCDDRLCQASLLLNFKFIEEDTNLGTRGPRALGFLGGSSGYP